MNKTDLINCSGKSELPRDAAKAVDAFETVMDSLQKEKKFKLSALETLRCVSVQLVGQPANW